MSLPVFLVAPDALAGPAVGGRVTAGPEVAGHAVRVRRMTVGEFLQLVDGRGTRVTGRLTAADAEGIALSVTAVAAEPAPVPALVLVQALAKGERDLAAIEAATEVGVDAVVPWAAQRSIADWPAKKAQKAAAKWRSTLTAATLQARRSRIPELAPLVRGAALADLVAADDAWIVLHESATAGLTAVLRRLAGEAAAGFRGTRAAAATDTGTAAAGATGTTAGSGPDRIVLVVGPEGGITDAEIAALTARGAATAVLGQTILRASTAGPVALGICQTALGRWA